MKTFSQINIKHDYDGSEHRKNNDASNKPVDEQTKDIVNGLFSTLQSIFPANGYHWSNDRIVSQAKEQWILALMENNIKTIEQVRRGVLKCRSIKSPFIPTPGEFIGYCMPDPKDFNLPTPQDAYDEALRHSTPYSRNDKWSHAVVYNAYKLTSSEALQRQGNYNEEKRVRNFFMANYEIIINKFVMGEPIDKLPLLIPYELPSEVDASKKGSDSLAALKLKLKQ